ncbi:molybdopterin-containing oxidoreductase family protein [Nisaea sediminum]|uniref:molybdopterin-containing oxidoreductase family protein n=1 Tax=Nisaea sediminum TaxID=2775867 RepID=UPI0018660E78|nr:molybdopterin-dependent oxidoreductase [Nisaea sediminum]
MSEPTRIPAFCTQCRSRCGCTATVAGGKLLRIEPLPEHPSGSKLCPKGLAAPELVYHPDRLTRPLRRTSPKGAAHPTWEAISWDEALDEIAGHMARIRDTHGPEQVSFSVTTPSGTHISDAISWIERFIRAYGSPNTIYGTEICNWHKDFASRFTYGTDIGTPDFARTDCVLLWGHNPTATWLARSTEVQKAIRRGAKLVVIDPRPTMYARRADAWLKVRPGTDQAVALGLLKLQLESDAFDQGFARRWSNAALLVHPETGLLLRESDVAPGGGENILLAAGVGGSRPLRYDAASKNWMDDPDGAELFGSHEILSLSGSVLCRTVLQTLRDAAADYTPERVEGLSGVPAEDLRKAAEILTGSASVAYYAWNGVGQSVTATQTDRAISSFYALTGHYGASGGNIPGGAARFNDISGQDLLSDTQRAKALGLAERPLGPGRHGWVTARDVYRAVLGGTPYPVRMLFSFGGNPLAAQPDTALAKQAFGKLEFHVHTDFFLNASAEFADIVLPAATSWEREGLRNGFDASLEGMRKVQLRPAAIAPVGEARSDTDIVLELSRRLGLAETMFDCDADKGHDHMLAPAGLDVATLRAEPEGVTLDGEVQEKPYLAAGFPTPSGLVELYSEQFLKHGQRPVPSLDPSELPSALEQPFPLRLGSAKTVVYCHSQHRNIPSLRRLQPDPILEIAPELAETRGIAERDWVEISTRAGTFRARAKLARGLAPDAVFAQHGWTIADAVPGAPLGANLNGAVPTERADPVSGSIPLRCSWCEVRKV